MFTLAEASSASVSIQSVEGADGIFDVTFTIGFPKGERVFVLGTFNEWLESDSSAMAREGNRWTKTLRLPRGDYEYKFRVVDHQTAPGEGWIHDQENAAARFNEHNTWNSLLSVVDDTIILRKPTYRSIEARRLALSFGNFEQLESLIRDLVEHRTETYASSNLSDFYGNATFPNDNAAWNTLEEWAHHSPTFHGVHILRGAFLINRAWAARGSGWSSTVTEEGFALFYADLKRARESLERAHSLEPRDPNASAMLITVCMGLNEPYEVMNRHFEDAIRASPIHLSAHGRKASYLYPRWHGGDGANLIQFVREFTPRIHDNPYLFDVASDAYNDFYEYPVLNKDFYRQPGVWSGLSKIYAIALENHPDTYYVYGNYVRVAFLADPQAQLAIDPMRLQITQFNWGLFNDLAYRLATHSDAFCRRGDAAVTIAKKVVEISARPDTLDTLSAAYAEAGDFPSALRTLSAALEMPMPDELRSELMNHMALFQNGRPARVPAVMEPERKTLYEANPAFSLTL